MSSNLLSNLSCSINIPKVTVNCKEVVIAVNKTLNKFCHESYNKDYSDLYNAYRKPFQVKKTSPVMQSEKIILCEINACLWEKALYSAISNISDHTYPHYVITQKFINYVLNASSSENFHLVEEYFWKLLFSHPPKMDMFDYYWQIVLESFAIFSESKTEDQTLIFCLVEAITNSLKTEVNSDAPSDLKKKTEFLCPNDANSSLMLKSAMENFNILLNKSPEGKIKRKQIYFADLPRNEKIKRCFLALAFAYDILEADFMYWLHSEKPEPTSSDSRPLLSHLLWQNARDIGLINKEVHKIIDLYKLVLIKNLEFKNRQLIEKLVTLLGELIRCSDKVEEIKYPFVGTKCDNFLRELSIALHEYITEFKKCPKENELTIKFKPFWLRLFLCSRVLSIITGYQCLPELSAVYDILEHIAYRETKRQHMTKTPEKPGNDLNSRQIQKLRRMKSINAKSRTGRTLLHAACEEDDVEKIKALLTFPELDLNAADKSGWTPLHAAAYKGNEASVQELLSFSPKWGDAQKPVNTRARGPESFTPLMCAASQSHEKVCQLLLEHSGSVLLEDVNEFNQTSLELSTSPEVMKVLDYYKKNNVWTLHSQNHINFDPDLKEVVLKLCVEMIEAYFCTYRTWDVYKTLKRQKNSEESSNFSDCDIKWDYMRYHRDIKRNIYKLRRLLPKLEHIKEFKKLHEIYDRKTPASILQQYCMTNSIKYKKDVKIKSLLLQIFNF